MRVVVVRLSRKPDWKVADGEGNGVKCGFLGEGMVGIWTTFLCSRAQMWSV